MEVPDDRFAHPGYGEMSHNNYQQQDAFWTCHC